MKPDKLALPLLALSFCGLCVEPVPAEAQTRLQANPAQLNLGFRYGGPPDSGNPSSFTVGTPGIGFTATAQTFSAAYGGWLSVSPLSGSTSQPITISVNAGNLTIGRYLGTVTLTFKGNYAPLLVPVWVSVHGLNIGSSFIGDGFGFTSEPVFDFTQGQIPNGCEIGSSVAACTAGIDDLGSTSAGSSFQLSPVTLDGGTWLGLSENSGVTPSTAVFTIDPTQIPAAIGVATGYVVVDGGTRGIDYVTVTVPAPQSSGFTGASALVAVVPPRKMAIGYLDAGNGSQTSIRLVNTGSLRASYQLQFWQTDPNSGQVGPLGVTMSDGTVRTQVSGTVGPGAMGLIDTSATASNEAVGWAELTTTGSLSGYAILSQSGASQISTPSEFVEGVIPFGLADRTLIAPFDNSNGEVTQMLLVNPGASLTSITLNFRDVSGNALGSGPQYVILGPNNQTLLSLSDSYPQSAGIAGTVELDGYSPISAVGLRFDAGGAFSYLPAFSVLPSQATSTLPLIAYAGGWQSTMMTFNPGSGSDSPNLAFYAPASQTSGSGVPLDLGFLNLPGKTAVSGSIPAGGVNVLQSANAGTNTQLGWISSSDSGPFTNGMELLRADAGGLVNAFSSSLPLAAAFQDRAIFPFDNTGGLSSLLFLTNADVSSSATFTVTVNDEKGNSVTPVSQGSISAHQFVSVSLNSGARGTITVTAVGHGFYGTLFRYSPGSLFTTIPGFQGRTGQ